MRLSFTVNHAHLVPEGIEGFVEALDFDRVHEVRLADCWRNGFEMHLKPGDGDLDFADMFRRVEGAGLSRPLHERVRLARRHAGGPGRFPRLAAAGTGGKTR